MDHLGPLSFIGGRYLMGCAVLLPVVLLRRRAMARRSSAQAIRQDTSKAIPQVIPPIINGKKRRDLLIGGVLCGLALCAASIAQQLGIMRTTVGKSGFITALYIIFVPLLGVFLRKKVPRIIWLGAVMAAVGMYLLCINEKFNLGSGDGWLFLGAGLFSIHIMLIDHYSTKLDGVALSCVQFLVAGIIGMVLGGIMEAPAMGDFIAGIIPLAYTGILSTGVAYTFQIVGQRDADPAVASLIFSMESVFAVLAGWWLLGQRLTVRELTGCAVMLAAVVLVQIPWRRPIN
jgi:drug/metabolite transporter (DMT)-like permease